VLALDHLIK